MDFLRSVKPRNKSEWGILLLVILLASATAVLAITKQLSPAKARADVENPVQLLAITTPASTVSPSTTASSSPPSPSPTTPPSTVTAAQDLPAQMHQLSALLQNFSEAELERMNHNLLAWVAHNPAATADADSDPAEVPGEAQLLELPPEVLATLEALELQAEAPAAEEAPAPALEPAPAPAVAAPTNLPGYPNNNPYNNYGLPQINPVSTIPQVQAQQAPYQPVPGAAVVPVSPAPGGGGGGAPPGQAPAPGQIVAIQSAVLDSINNARRNAGLPALVYDGTLQTIASQRAVDLSIYYQSGHIRPDGNFSLSWITSAYGASYAQGENIGYFDNVGNCTASRIFQTFFDSPSHYSIMMDPAARYAAIGVYCVPGMISGDNTGDDNLSGNGRYYVSMNFGT